MPSPSPSGDPPRSPTRQSVFIGKTADISTPSPASLFSPTSLPLCLCGEKPPCTSAHSRFKPISNPPQRLIPHRLMNLDPRFRKRTSLHIKYSLTILRDEFEVFLVRLRTGLMRGISFARVGKDKFLVVNTLTDDAPGAVLTFTRLPHNRRSLLKIRLDPGAFTECLCPVCHRVNSNQHLPHLVDGSIDLDRLDDV